MEYWIQHEAILAWVLLLSAFVIVALWETYFPRRVAVAPAGRRWLNHAILQFFTGRGVFWVFRASGVMIAYSVADSPLGLLNREFIPLWARYVAAVLLLDLSRYGQHCLYHAVAFLWRIHQVHHSDPDYDWSTGLRFHPVETLLRQGSDLAIIALLAPPPLAILALDSAEVGLNLFSHANASLPPWLDTAARWFLITPDMHRIHHSDDVAEQNKNFGITLPWWDRLFGTYLANPALGHEKMGVGLREVSERDSSSLLGILAMPFRDANVVGRAAYPAYNSTKGESNHGKGYGPQERS